MINLNRPLCALVIGHHEEVPGASSVTGVTEYEYNSDLAVRIAQYVNPLKCLLHGVRRQDPHQMPYHGVRRSGCHFFVSLHFNAAKVESANGTETLHWHASAESKRLAQILQSHMLSALGTRDRGLKPVDSDDRGAPLLQRTPMPGVIVEPGFGSNDVDWHALVTEKDALASALADGIMQYARHVAAGWR